MRKKTAQFIEEHNSLKAKKSRKPRKDKGKKRERFNPKSKENLRPYPKGVSGNPGGLPGTDLAAIIARQIFEQDPEAAMAGLAAQLKKGNAYAFSVLADRGYGKVKETIEHTGSVNLTLEQVDARLLEIVKGVRSA